MNKRLPEMPNLGSEAYAPMMPEWFANSLRLFSVLFAIALAWFSIHDWAKMPLWAQWLVCILVPAFLFSALHSKGWSQYSSIPCFLADHLGMYFKHKNALTTHLGKNAEIENNQRKNWLFVPWENISNIRISKVSTHDGSFNGAVLDVKATEEELVAFFSGKQIDKHVRPDGSVSVAFYMNVPPMPRKVVAIVNEMMSRYKKSALSTKYERAR
ncbi:MAG: hypothetical protein Q7T58_03960 [Methylotenera sp.]|nr:hypothetical protein [Methylotenera sp.]